jgi:DNA-binding MarR family transcriptional regulator
MTFNRKPAQDSGYLLWQISNIWQRQINELLSEYKITHVQYLLLATIIWMEEQGMSINQNNLARQASSHKMMTSKVLRSLEREGYISRQDNPRDTRSKLISLTYSGKQKFLEVKQLFESEDRKFFGKLERNRFSLNKVFSDLLEETRAIA